MDPVFPGGGEETSKRGAPTYYFVKNCMKMKQVN